MGVGSGISRSHVTFLSTGTDTPFGGLDRLVLWPPFAHQPVAITTHLTSPTPMTVLPRPGRRHARLATYGAPAEPPRVEEFTGSPEEILDSLVERVASASPLPTVAVREAIDNLLHADLVDASVSVLDDGWTLRISDRGPGIADKGRAFEPGYSTATTRMRSLVRGVGSGLPVCRAALGDVGGSIDIDDNLDRGTVVTLRVPQPGRETTRCEDTDPSDQARHILAVLLELGSTTPDMVAHELGLAPPICAAELADLRRRGLVDQTDEGTLALNDAGTSLLTKLF